MHRTSQASRLPNSFQKPESTSDSPRLMPSRLLKTNLELPQKRLKLLRLLLQARLMTVSRK